MILEVNDLSFGYVHSEVLHKVQFEIEKPGVIAVIGPNGVGKSTLFKLILGLLKPSSGDVLIGGRSISGRTRGELAKLLAYIPQSHFPTYNYSVLNMVLMGMVSEVGMFSTPSKVHRELAIRALKELEIAHLAKRGYAQLSGGERQLALIARALVQDAKILVMDEPTANLDFGNQLMVMQKIGALSKEGYTVLVSLHNPQHAYLYADRSLVLYDRGVLAYGETNHVLDRHILETIYSIGIHLIDVDNEGVLTKVPMPKL